MHVWAAECLHLPPVPGVQHSRNATASCPADAQRLQGLLGSMLAPGGGPAIAHALLAVDTAEKQVGACSLCNLSCPSCLQPLMQRKPCISMLLHAMP